ncbi:MAG: hypothetical protein A4E48_00293 [Methanosaeta sp. PtaU1.Bin060]|nr:MAG: hypothetical protein A4E48_00293 [Methanosaeta sp. PtaU1.Bin060]
MANLGMFRDDSNTPTGFTEIGSGYRDRLIKGGGTALDTGGTDNHEHSMSSWSCNNVNGTTSDGGSTPITGVNHTHNSASINGSASHLPPYKNLRVLLISADTFNGVIPAGTIVFHEDVPSGWDRYDGGSSYFIRISSTAGGTGGSLTHSHTISGTTSGPSATGTVTGTSSWRYCPNNHTHTFSGTSSTSSSSDYYYWACGLIKASADRILPLNSIVLADGSLSGDFWEEVTGASGRLLRISSTNSITTGGSSDTFSHTHSFSGTTDQMSQSTVVGGGSYYTVALNTHTHSISFNLSATNPEPSYVRLKLYKLIRLIGSRFVNAIVI